MQTNGKPKASVRGGVLRLLGAAGVAGVLTAGIALPAVGTVGMTAKSATEALHLAPEELDEPPLPEKTVLWTPTASHSHSSTTSTGGR